jgi:hypothetical protein
MRLAPAPGRRRVDGRIADMNKCPKRGHMVKNALIGAVPGPDSEFCFPPDWVLRDHVFYWGKRLKSSPAM